MIVKVIYSYSRLTVSLIQICYSLSSACKCYRLRLQVRCLPKVCITFRTCCMAIRAFLFASSTVGALRSPLVLYRLMINCPIPASLLHKHKFTVCGPHNGLPFALRGVLTNVIRYDSLLLPVGSQVSDSWLNQVLKINITLIIYINCCYISCGFLLYSYITVWEPAVNVPFLLAGWATNS